MAKSSRKRTSRIQQGCAAALLALLAGCGGGPKLFPVSGVVTLDGKPVEGAAVLFAPAGGGSPAAGTTNREGRYQLNTGERSGALAGKYKVSVTLQEVGAWQGDPTGTSGSPPPGTPMGKWIVPQRYSLPQTSGLTAEVGGSGKQFDFSLSSSTTSTQAAGS